MGVRPVAVLGLLLLSATAGAEEPAPAWTYGASLGLYVVPDQTTYLQPTLRADHGPVHVEARYNYEAARTASFFVGWTWEVGEELVFSATPMLGCMVGEAGGPILALELSLSWRWLGWSSEAEWVWDVVNGTGGYFYAWSELTVSPWEWLHAGVALQRTRVFHTAREVVFGPMLGVSVWKMDLTTYWFQPGGVDQLFVVSLGIQLP